MRLVHMEDERDPSLRDLSPTEWKAVAVRAGKAFLANNGTMLASALAYSAFFAIPSVLLVTLGVFTLVAGADTILTLTGHLQTVMPAQATGLLRSSLLNLGAHPASGILMTVFGFALALWSTTGAMNSLMLAVNLSYGRRDTRPFLRKRLVALEMTAALGCALVLVAGLLVFGPVVERAVASRLGSAGAVLDWAWWIAQWPILLGGLLAAFATLLHLGPDVPGKRWRFLTPGSLVAAVLWIAVSGLFAVYTSAFGSYNKTWGSLSAVIVTLTWLWLTSIALLLGAELNAELERSREPRGRLPVV
jgi:membrane protein